MTPTRRPWGLTFCPINPETSLLLGSHAHGDVRRSLQYPEHSSLSSGLHSLESGARAGVALADVQSFLVHVEVMFGVGDSLLEDLEDHGAGSLGSVSEDALRQGDVLSSDEVEHDGDLSGRDPDFSSYSFDLFSHLSSPFPSGVGGL